MDKWYRLIVTKAADDGAEDPSDEELSHAFRCGVVEDGKFDEYAMAKAKELLDRYAADETPGRGRVKSAELIRVLERWDTVLTTIGPSLAAEQNENGAGPNPFADDSSPPSPVAPPAGTTES